MNADKVIEVLEKWHKYAPDYIQDDILQAISIIKENDELRKVLRDAEKKIADLKKAVAREGLGVEDLTKILIQYIEAPVQPHHVIAQAIVEAQTKYKKGEV